MIDVKDEKIGEHYKIVSGVINGIKYYFVIRIGIDGFLVVFRNMRQAIDVFKSYERDAKLAETPATEKYDNLLGK